MASNDFAASRNTDLAPARLHLWRLLSLLGGLVGVLVLILLLVTSAG